MSSERNCLKLMSDKIPVMTKYLVRLAHKALAKPFTFLMNALIENFKLPSEMKYTG